MKAHSTSSPRLDLHSGRPPILNVHDAGEPANWATTHREALRAAVATHGSLLVRGLGLSDATECAALFRHLGVPTTDQEAYAPRKVYAEGVFASMPWPASRVMCPHPELSYRSDVPALLMFACLTAPQRGGATSLSDASKVLESLPPALVERFERFGWTLVRSYNPDIGASMAQVFGTDDRAAVEQYCRDHAIKVEWRENGLLRTQQRRAAVVRHPATGKRCWFNEAAFLSAWSMDPEVREYLVDVYGEDGLPFDTRFGDGGAIGEDVVTTINQAYEAVAVREPWESGDLLLVDNIRTAHGRDVVSGACEVVVGLADDVRVA